jgi:toxin ParE1/3/4
MVPVVWAAPALDDLQEIHDFIARDSPRYAQITVERITQSTDRLAQFPESGPVLPEFPERSYRHIIVGHYRLLYRYDLQNRRVLVMGVIHAARDLPPIMENR